MKRIKNILIAVGFILSANTLIWSVGFSNQLLSRRVKDIHEGVYLKELRREGDEFSAQYYEGDKLRFEIQGNPSESGVVLTINTYDESGVLLQSKRVETGQESFKSPSFDVLHSWLADYYYQQALQDYQGLRGASFKAFMETVEALNKIGDVSPETIEQRLNTIYDSKSFSGFGLYSRHYKDFLRIHRRGIALGKDFGQIQDEMINYSLSIVRGKRTDAQMNLLQNLPQNTGILSITDSLPKHLDTILKGSDRFLSLEEASREIQQDIDDGFISSFGGWLGIGDLDNLRLFNAIYSKPIVNVVLRDMRRIFNYYLSREGGFAFSFRTGDEIGIYIPATEDAEVVTTDIRNTIQNLHYEIFTLSENISSEQLSNVKKVLAEYDAYISPQLYGGRQLGIIRFRDSDESDKLSQMFNVLRYRYGVETSARTYLGSVAIGTLLPTFSAGIVSLKDKEEVKPLEQSFHQAEDTLRAAKSNGKNRDVIGYNETYSHSHTGKHIISEEFLMQLDEADAQGRRQGLTPRVDNEQQFRNKVYSRVSQEQSGMLVIINPRYDDGVGFHDMNEKYTYIGGDDIIRTLAHFCSAELGTVSNGVLFGRSVDRIFVFIPGFTEETPGYEDILREKLSRIKFDFENQIPIVEIAFKVYAAFTDEEAQEIPGLLFQKVAYAQAEDKGGPLDLWGTFISIYGVETESNAADIESNITQEAFQELVAQILSARIIPLADTIDQIKSLCLQDPVLSRIYWQYILRVINQRSLFPG